MTKITDIERWRIEIQLAEKFREDQFGKYSERERSKAGENIEYFENGFRVGDQDVGVDQLTTLNLIDPIVTVMVSSLYLRNPRTVATPAKQESQDTAPIVGKTIDHYRHALEMEEINQKIIWDAYVLGYGVYKIGYATQFGTDIPDEEREKRGLFERALEAVGLKKKPEEEVSHPEMDYRITSESPYVMYINPFDFLLDPRATSLNDAMWWGHRIRKTVRDIKNNKKYKNTEGLKGEEPDIRTFDLNDVTGSALEEFLTVDLYEIHYRLDDEIYIMVISKDGEEEYRAHYHEKSIYKMGWQCDMLMFKKHGHMLYPRSDITKLKNLQDRITTTIDAILEQVDKFVPKLAYQTGDLTPHGKISLETGGIGALVECNRNPNEVFKELNFTQLKADLLKLIEEIISLISIQTGITRAQLTGLSDMGSATEATIAQGGQTLKTSDMNEKVRSFINRQSEKLWSVIAQFVDLQELQLINGQRGIDEKTGMPMYDWIMIDDERNQKMIDGKYRWDIETGSTQRVDLGVVRKAFENLYGILARTEVIAIMQQQGKKVDLAELLKKYIDLFPEMGIDAGKIVQNITQQTTGLLPPEMTMPGGQQGGMTSGSQDNAVKAMRGQSAPTGRQMISEGSQI